MHELEYAPRSQGGQNWSGAGAGYIARCICGSWTYDGVVRDPMNPPEGLKTMHLLHRASVKR